MSDKFQNKYRIPSARMQSWDYDSNAYYFITICTSSKEHYFGEIEGGEMLQNFIAQHFEEQIKNVQTHYPYAEIPIFVIMPNHVHLIVCITNGARTVSTTAARWKTDIVDEKMQQISRHRKSLSVLVGGIKSATTRYANANKIRFGWQTRFHDHIIRDNAEYVRISHYINTNIENWENDCFY